MIRLFFDSCKKCKRNGSTTAEGKCYYCGADYTKELGMPQPDPAVMTPEQIAMQVRRLFLEEQIWQNQKYLAAITRECKEHFIIKGRIYYCPAKIAVVNSMEGRYDKWNDGDFSASCAVCGEDFGWWCPKSPTHYCEYDENNIYGCKYCGQPDERK